MARKKVPRVDKRFKARYGSTVRKRWNLIMLKKIKSYECPKCRHRAVKRTSVGIWSCRKCGFTFAGGAYTPFTITKTIRVE
jgi:large subunit ribosomal protein L37Ae